MSAHWERLQALFDAAVTLPPADRAAYLLSACPDDSDLRHEVAEMLALDARAEGGEFIASPIAAGMREIATASAASRIGERVGPYRLLEVIGHGGMGTVYLVERADQEYSARVAIKFVRGAFAAPELMRRLRVERQVLAGLRHPSIARLLDGGTAADGTPYLVMEAVDGEPIDAWCEARRLGVHDRLALSLKVCAAVQYAHQALVVHRDLKPSNILVREDGTPALVDFGIAKLLDPAADDAGEPTATLGIMTPSYASPEQIRGQRVTIATDIYSLGVVLYRVLTGRLPFDLGDATPAEVERRVSAEEPPRPSQVAVDRARARELAGDLDTIVLKALRKEPERRYGTVAALVDDIERYLEGRPIAARRDRLSYVAGKFARRHRGALAVAVGIVLLVGGLTAFYTVRLRSERDLATAQAARADQVVAFLKNIFVEASPEVAEGTVLTAPELLAQGVKRIPAELAGDPATQADLMNVIGDVYRGLGMYREAEAQLERALAVRRRAHIPADTVLADILNNLSVVTRVGGDLVSADTFAQQGVALLRRLVGTDNRAYASALNSLAEVKRVRGEYAAAESLYYQDLAIRRRILPGVHQDIAESLNNLSLALLGDGKYAEAEARQREALTIRIELGAPDRFEVSNSESNLGIILTREHMYPEAESLFTKALAERRQMFGVNEPRTLNTEQNYGSLLYAEGRYAEAQQVLEDALRRMRAVLPPEHRFAATAMKWLALTLSARGMHDSARAVATRSVAGFMKQVGPTRTPTLQALRALGLVDAAAGRRAAAESLLLATYDTQRMHLGAGHPEARETAEDLVSFYEAWGKPEEAARYRRAAADTTQ